jgi:two-component sensor histidine kinase
MAIASTQRRLRLGTDNETCDVNELLSDLVEDLKATVPMGNGMNMTYRGDPITMSARDAVSIGVIVGELVTNCLKYAFPDNGVGAIEVSLTREDEETARLEVADDGIGALAETPLSGLGSMIIATLSESIGGTIERSVANGDGGLSGMRVAVTFPVAPSAAEPT